jgi:hypothetical protein
MTPEERTTPIGLFNFARSYWRSSEQLRASKPDVTHPDAPILFLFYHAIELYLKAFVRNAGYDLKQLKDISHRITKAGRAAHDKGLQLTPDDFELLGLVDAYDNVIRSRYITTGAHSRPEEDALSDFCQYLDRSVGERLASDGHPIREKSFSQPAKVPVSKTIEDHLREEVETLSKKEREILAYLLHHNQRMFTCDTDGGHAATLISRSIVRRAVKPGQVFAFDDMPVEVPLEVWRFLRANADKFPYDGDDDDPHPWRVRRDRSPVPTLGSPVVNPGFAACECAGRSAPARGSAALIARRVFALNQSNRFEAG